MSLRILGITTMLGIFSNFNKSKWIYTCPLNLDSALFIFGNNFHLYYE
jgi:hypothetical protein